MNFLFSATQRRRQRPAKPLQNLSEFQICCVQNFLLFLKLRLKSFWMPFRQGGAASRKRPPHCFPQAQDFRPAVRRLL